VPLLPESLRGDVIEEALEAGRTGDDHTRLFVLAPYLSEAQSQAFVRDIPNVALLGGERALVQTLGTIRDIGKFWR
jgi:hypothetical protein